MKPMQITSFVEVIAKCNIFQAAVTMISIALHFSLLRKALVHDLLQGFSFEVVHNLHPDEERNPILRLGYCRYSFDLVCSPTTFSVMGGTADIVIIHLYNVGKLVMSVSLPHSLADSL